MQRRQFIQASAFTALTTTSVVWAQSTAWPDKPIKFVLSQPHHQLYSLGFQGH